MFIDREKEENGQRRRRSCWLHERVGMSERRDVSTVDGSDHSGALPTLAAPRSMSIYIGVAGCTHKPPHTLSTCRREAACGGVWGRGQGRRESSAGKMVSHTSNSTIVSAVPEAHVGEKTTFIRSSSCRCRPPRESSSLLCPLTDMLSHGSRDRGEVWRGTICSRPG